MRCWRIRVTDIYIFFVFAVIGNFSLGLTSMIKIIFAGAQLQTVCTQQTALSRLAIFDELSLPFDVHANTNFVLAVL